MSSVATSTTPSLYPEDREGVLRQFPGLEQRFAADEGERFIAQRIEQNRQINQNLRESAERVRLAQEGVRQGEQAIAEARAQQPELERRVYEAIGFQNVAPSRATPNYQPVPPRENNGLEKLIELICWVALVILCFFCCSIILD